MKIHPGNWLRIAGPVASLSFAAALSAQVGQDTGSAHDTNAVIWSNGQKEVDSNRHEIVGSPREIHRTPLFDNAPFLRLRAGDKFLKAKRWDRYRKGGPPVFSHEEYCFILSSGAYYFIWTVEEGHKLDLFVPQCSLLFDWDLTLSNAATLKDLYVNHLGQPVPSTAYPSIRTTVRRKFPAAVRHEGDLDLSAPHIKDEGKKASAVFEGLGFDRNVLFQYRFEIGNEIFLQTRKPLIVGPRFVEPWELKRPEGVNAPIVWLSPEKLPAERAACKESQRFRALVEPLLPPYPSSPASVVDRKWWQFWK